MIRVARRMERLEGEAFVDEVCRRGREHQGGE